MAEIYKLIHPNKYFTDYITRNTRNDGRKFDDFREIKLSVNSITAADSSAIVKCGNTTVVCGIKLELAKPKAEEPNLGYLVTNVELIPLCSSRFRPGPPSDHAQVINNIVSDIIVNSKCIDLKDLCIESDKLCWVVYCDIICLDNDGSLVDACIMTAMASLKTLTLPSINYNVETEEIKVDTTIRKSLPINGLPVASSFAIWAQSPSRSIVLTDPTAYEEDMCGGMSANVIVCWNQGLFCGIEKHGGNNLPAEYEKEIFKVAKQRSKLIDKVINASIQNGTTISPSSQP